MNRSQFFTAAGMVLAVAAWHVRANDTPAWAGEEGSWPFEVADDAFTGEELFNPRSLLCGVAGEKGWISHDANGAFVRGDGSPIRFWAVHTGADLGRDFAEVEAHARHLAKRGVNLVRYATIFARGHENPIGHANDVEIDRFHKLVAAMKKHGIYTTASLYREVAVRAGFGGYKPFGREEGDLSGLMFWEPELQAAHRNWWRELLTRPNPYCPERKPLKDDPAFAILQTQNESSMFFWTQQGLNNNPAKKAEYDALNRLFKAWLAENGLPVETDLDFQFWSIDNGGDTTRTPEPRFPLTMRFAAELMRKFNTDFEKFIRGEIGCPVLINAGNWQTANQARLLDLERWAYGANAVQGKNAYVDWGSHMNPQGRGGWLIEKGDHYQSASALRGDGWKGLAPLAFKREKGRPFIVPESSWVLPNGFVSEGPLLVAAYSGLTGLDAFYWFSTGHTWHEVGINPWNPGMWKWPTQGSPSVMGGWPAAAWMFHKGYVKRGELAVDEKRALEGDMWELRPPVVSESSHYDPNRPGTVRALAETRDGAPFGAFFIGPVEVEYGKPADETRVDLNGQNPADLARGVIRSNTGELFLNAPRGIFTLDAPKAQGVSGFLREHGVVETGALSVDMENPYATVMAVSLDDKPLSNSGKILLQVTTRSFPTGWRETAATYNLNNRDVEGMRIDEIGTTPWRVETARGVVAVRNAGLSKATRTDANFYAAGDWPVERRDGALAVKLPANALYVVLE